MLPSQEQQQKKMNKHKAIIIKEKIGAFHAKSGTKCPVRLTGEAIYQVLGALRAAPVTLHPEPENGCFL